MNDNDNDNVNNNNLVDMLKRTLEDERAKLDAWEPSTQIEARISLAETMLKHYGGSTDTGTEQPPHKRASRRPNCLRCGKAYSTHHGGELRLCPGSGVDRYEYTEVKPGEQGEQG